MFASKRLKNRDEMVFGAVLLWFSMPVRIVLLAAPWSREHVLILLLHELGTEIGIVAHGHCTRKQTIGSILNLKSMASQIRVSSSKHNLEHSLVQCCALTGTMWNTKELNQLYILLFNVNEACSHV